MEAEKEIRGKVEDAHSQAQKIVRSAETSSREIVEKSRQKAVKDGQDLIERLTNEAEKERDLQVGKVKGGGAELMNKRSSEIEGAVKRIIDIVTGREQA